MEYTRRGEEEERQNQPSGYSKNTTRGEQHGKNPNSGNIRENKRERRTNEKPVFRRNTGTHKSNRNAGERRQINEESTSNAKATGEPDRIFSRRGQNIQQNVLFGDGEEGTKGQDRTLNNTFSFSSSPSHKQGLITAGQREREKKNNFYYIKHYAPNKTYMFNVSRMRFYADTSNIKQALLEQYSYSQEAINRLSNIQYDYRKGFVNVPLTRPAFKLLKLPDKSQYNAIKKQPLINTTPAHALKILHQKGIISKNRLRKILKHGSSLNATEKEHINTLLKKNSTSKKSLKSYAHIHRFSEAERRHTESREYLYIDDSRYQITLKKRTAQQIERIKKSTYLYEDTKRKRLQQINDNIRHETMRRYKQYNAVASIENL